MKFPKYNNADISSQSPSLNPWFITGFSDAESCFTVTVWKDSKTSLGWRVNAQFLIGLHKKDEELLKLIQAYFGEIGRCGKFAKDAYVFRVNSIKQIVDIILQNF